MPTQSNKGKNISYNFSGKTFLVTGAANGIGKAIASSLLDANANVYGLDLAEMDTSTLACDPSRVENFKFIRGDICSENVWSEATQDIMATSGCLDGLVNCAGLLYVETIDGLTRPTFDKTFSVNVFGTMLGVQQCIPCLEKSNCATIVNFASISGLVGTSFSSIYAATKGAIISYTRAMANELANKSNPIRGICISPGVIVTDMTEQHWDAWKELYKYKTEEAMRADTINRQLVKRNGQIADLSNLVSFVLSEESSFINGENIVIDGGFSI